MSGLNFIGRLDRRDEALILDQLQEQKFADRLLGHRDPMLVKRLFGYKPVRNVYVPPTRGVNGANKVMPKN
jgi:hypothetical protein